MPAQRYALSPFSVDSNQPGSWAGLLLTTAVACVALWLGRIVPVIGGPVFGIVLGIFVRNIFSPGGRFDPGIRFASKYILQWSIVALGAGLSLSQVARTGVDSLAVTSVTITVAGISAWGLGRMLGVGERLKLLVGVGTAICGGSAIAAVTPIVKPDDHETAFAISTIFLFNLVAVLIFPALGHLLHLSDAGFGMWAGTAINDTSSVVAAGYSYSKAAGDYATVVKLTRATLIIPICLVLTLVVAYREKRQGAGSFKLARIFPWFILWFLVALTAVGLSSSLRRMAATGVRPILLGLGVWVAVAASSLAIQLVMGQM